MKKYGAGEEQENCLRSNNFLSFVAYNMIEKKIMKIILYHCISEKIIIKKKTKPKKDKLMATWFQRAEKRLFVFFLFLLIILLISLPSERYNLKISTLMWVFWENHHFLTGKEFSLTCSLGNFCPCHVYHPCSGFNSLMPTLIYLVSAQPEYSLLGGLMFWISWMMDIFKASIVKNLHLDQSYTSRHTSGLSDSDCCFFLNIWP